MRRFLLLASAIAILGGVAAAPSGAVDRGVPEVIQLPVGFQPEGIAAGRGATFYVGSIPTGAVFRGSFRSGEGEVLVPGRAGRAAIGVAFDRRGNRLFVAGGPTGKAFVYDARTGADVATFELTTATAFINDVVVRRRAAWFTDSLNKVLYRVPIASDGSLGGAETVALSGDIVYGPGFNVNGIDAGRDGETLVIVQSNTGKLFTVDPHTGGTKEIDLGGGDVLRGDGIMLRGRTLFVVQNVLNRVAVIKLSRDLQEGRIVRYITDSDLDVPTTIDEFAGRLWAVNARFGIASPEAAQFQVVQLRRDAGERHGAKGEHDDADHDGESEDHEDSDDRDD